MNKRFKIFQLQRIEPVSVSPQLYRDTFTLTEVYFDGDGLPTQEVAEKELENHGYNNVDYVILPVLRFVSD